MIYVHIPFCKSFCTYCGFYSEICDDKVQNLFMSSLLDEIRSRREELPCTGHSPATLYIGGGTPSLLSAQALGQIVSALGSGPYEEFTVEVNPEDIVTKGEDYVRALLSLGVNRISMGVQSFDDSTLKWMNRRHDADTASEAYRILRSCGVGNISLDLIFGLPEGKGWEDSVREIISLRPEHISAYQLSVEPDSALEMMRDQGKWKEASPEECSEAYRHLCGALAEAGYVHYEISNFALPGREAVHNSAYWKRVPYVGLGPAAHSFDGKVRSWNSGNPYAWTRESETLSEEDARVEEIMLSLRTSAGMSAERAAELCRNEDLERLGAAGMLAEENGRIRIPEARFFISDAIVRELI